MASFNSFFGNGSLKNLMASMIASNKLPHCLLFEGAEGLGKQTFAKLVAKAALCSERLNGAAVPCGKCPSCVKCEKGIHPDITVIEGAGASGSFPVDTIRALRLDAFVVPTEGDRKVFIILGADTMSDQSQNALLTILEEPPSYGLFIITCKSASALLPTIRSRATAFSLSPVTPSESKAFLEKRYPEYDKSYGEKLLLSCAGNLGEIVSQVEGISDSSVEFSAKLVENLLKTQELPLLLQCAELEKNRLLSRRILSVLESIFRDALIIKTGGTALLFSDSDVPRSLAGAVSAKKLISLAAVLSEASIMLDRNIHGGLFSTWFPAALRNAAGL